MITFNYYDNLILSGRTKGILIQFDNLAFSLAQFGLLVMKGRRSLQDFGSGLYKNQCSIK
jgi:hypothetical protein